MPRSWEAKSSSLMGQIRSRDLAVRALRKGSSRFHEFMALARAGTRPVGL